MISSITTDTNCEMMVAKAAPRTPISNTKMKIGSRITFKETAKMVAYIEMRG